MKMNKNNFENKLINWFVGSAEDRDEYQRSVIFETLAKENMISFWLITIGMLVSLCYDLAVLKTVSAGTIILFLLLYFKSLYMTIVLRKKGLVQSEYYDKASYQRAVDRLKHKSVIVAVQFGLGLWIIGLIIDKFSGEAIIINRSFWINLIVDLLSGPLFAICMYFFAKTQLKLIEEDK